MKNLKDNDIIAPHISIYYWSITMVASIIHRISGCIIYFFNIFLVLWISSFVFGENIFNIVNNFYTSIFGRILLFVYTFSIMLHGIGGVRHILFDVFPCLLTKNLSKTFSNITIYISISLTIIIWIFALKYNN